jgi:hypothetical protein
MTPQYITKRGLVLNYDSCYLSFVTNRMKAEIKPIVASPSKTENCCLHFFDTLKIFFTEVHVDSEISHFPYIFLYILF